jgi:homoserine/homoserine lactone efflux protein
VRAPGGPARAVGADAARLGSTPGGPTLSIEAWLAFCLTEAVLCVTPGPAVLLVVSAAMRHGLRAGLGASLGILTANAFYFAVSAAGVAAALVASREVFLVLKWAGAAYLVVLGLRMLFRPARSGPPASRARLGRAFAHGVVVQGANPKVLVFFVALLPQFLDPAGSIPGQTLVLGLSSIAIELVALGAYALLAVRARRLPVVGRADALERVGGGLLVAAGAGLARVRME